VGIDHVRDAEVGELHTAVFVNEDVLRLHVTVNDALRMGLAERVGELKRNADRDLGRHFFVLQNEVLQRGAGEKLGRDVRLIRRLPAVVVDLENVGMPQPGHALGLAGEPGSSFARPLQMRMKHLERDEPVERAIARSVDGSHSAVADLVEDLVLLQLT